MRHVNHDYDLDFDDPRARWLSEQILAFNLMVLTVRNYFFLKENPGRPHLYDSGMVYLLPEQLENRPSESAIADLRRFLGDRMHMTNAQIAHHLDLARGVEIFRDIPRMEENGGGDCDNWAAAIAAERAVAGADVVPYMTNRQQGGRTIYHALDKWRADGSSEDPSIIMGMGGQSKAAERREEVRKNVERHENYQRDAARYVEATGDESRIPEMDAAIERIGLLPKDGIFRVPNRIAKPARKWWGLRAA